MQRGEQPSVALVAEPSFLPPFDTSTDPQLWLPFFLAPLSQVEYHVMPLLSLALSLSLPPLSLSLPVGNIPAQPQEVCSSPGTVQVPCIYTPSSTLPKLVSQVAPVLCYAVPWPMSIAMWVEPCTHWRHLTAVIVLQKASPTSAVMTITTALAQSRSAEPDEESALLPPILELTRHEDLTRNLPFSQCCRF